MHRRRIDELAAALVASPPTFSRSSGLTIFGLAYYAHAEGDGYDASMMGMALQLGLCLPAPLAMVAQNQPDAATSGPPAPLDTVG